MSDCALCPRRCHVDRNSQHGYCGASGKISVNLHQPHYGEEPVISGTRGSGTIFFAHCNMRCVFCQNHSISVGGHGEEMNPDKLAQLMCELQERGTHNVNLVTPTHYTPQLREAIMIAKKAGLRIPVVWNSNAYENPETLKTLEGLVDIYLPDFKYSDPKMSLRYSDASGYPRWAKSAIMEMFRQVGHLNVNYEGLAVRGLLIRLLILPGDINGIKNILDWILTELGDQTHISLMGQYYPTHRSCDFSEINRPLTEQEYDFALLHLEKLGFENGFIQEVGSSADQTPAFRK